MCFRGRWTTRNSAMAAINKIKAGNIQLGSCPPIVSCACLAVYSGPAGDLGRSTIYEDDGYVKNLDVVSQVESADSAVLQPVRCMVPQSSSPYPYR